MHTKYCSLIGITAIENLDRTGEERSSGDPNNQQQNKKHKTQPNPEVAKLVKDLYRDEQFFDISKARFGKAGRIAIKREFEYQRFRELRDIDLKN